MADRTIGELPAHDEINIGDLPVVPDIYDDTKIPVEQQGEARHITGKQWIGYAQATTVEYADAAKKSADAAAKSAEDAAGSLGQLGDAVEEAQGYAQEAGASAEAAEQTLAAVMQAKNDAETAAGNAAASEEAAAGSATKAETEAQAASDSAYDAARSATAAAASERSAKTAQETTQQAMAQALQARDAAQESAGDAANSADVAQQYSGNPPIIKDGNWWTWDAESGDYTDTGKPARGEQGIQGPPGKDGEGTGDMEAATYDPQGKRQDIFKAIEDGLKAKQDTLTFDEMPQEKSDNPVKSSGIYQALQDVKITTDATPTQGSEHPVQSGGVYDALETRVEKVKPAAPGNVPTLDADGKLQDSGVKLEDKQDALAGKKGQMVGFSDDGTPEAQDMPAGTELITATLTADGWTEKAQTVEDPRIMADAKFVYLLGLDSAEMESYTGGPMWADEVTEAGKITIHTKNDQTGSVNILIIKMEVKQ